jgi:hypothetical protein
MSRAGRPSLRRKAPRSASFKNRERPRAARCVASEVPSQRACVRQGVKLLRSIDDLPKEPEKLAVWIACRACCMRVRAGPNAWRPHCRGRSCWCRSTSPTRCWSTGSSTRSASTLPSPALIRCESIAWTKAGAPCSHRRWLAHMRTRRVRLCAPRHRAVLHGGGAHRQRADARHQPGQRPHRSPHVLSHLSLALRALRAQDVQGERQRLAAARVRRLSWRIGPEYQASGGGSNYWNITRFREMLRSHPTYAAARRAARGRWAGEADWARELCCRLVL